jgi:hypothetical protein
MMASLVHSIAAVGTYDKTIGRQYYYPRRPCRILLGHAALKPLPKHVEKVLFLRSR